MLWKRIIETRNESNWGERGTGVQNLPPTIMVFAFGNQLDRSGRLFSIQHFEEGYSSKVKFWYDLWCGDSLLKEEFLDIFFISHDQDSSIAGLLQFNNGMKHWDLHFSRSVQDWELDSLDRFMELIYSSSMSGKGDDKMG